MIEYENYDALDLAQLVRRREVTPKELLDAAWQRTKRLNGALNAIVWPNRGLAEKAIDAGLPKGPFHGVPFVIKDILATVEGFPATNGSRLFEGQIAAADSELVRRHKAAGFVIFGMTTTPELGMNPTSEAAIYGKPTSNPWNPARSSGGSSGGAAAAVAAGILPIAHASDGGGSIRVPASACGVFGFKPTRGRNPMGPKIGETWGGLGVEHAVSRSVRDSAALLDVTQGADAGAPYAAPGVEGSYLEATMSPPSRLRIGLVEKSPGGFPVHPDCLAAVRETAKLCEDLGHIVESTSYPDYDFEMIFHAHCLMMAAGSAAFIKGAAAMLGRPPTDNEIEPSTRDAAQYAEGVSAADYGLAVAAFHAIGRKTAALMQQYDVLLTPSLMQPPVKLGYFVTSMPFLELRRRVIAYTGFLPLANYTGFPAMSMPLHWNDENLPIGSHFLGRFGAERTLFALAAELEQARPWFNRRPVVTP